MKVPSQIKVVFAALCAGALLFSQQVCGVETLFADSSTSAPAHSHEHSNTDSNHQGSSHNHGHRGDSSHHDGSDDDTCCKTQSPLSVSSVFTLVTERIVVCAPPSFLQASLVSSADLFSVEVPFFGPDPPLNFLSRHLLLSLSLSPNAPPFNLV